MQSRLLLSRSSFIFRKALGLARLWENTLVIEREDTKITVKLVEKLVNASFFKVTAVLYRFAYIFVETQKIF